MGPRSLRGVGTGGGVDAKCQATTGIARRAWWSVAAVLVVIWMLLFLPAGSLHFWQAWTFWFVYAGCASAITGYFLRRDPDLIRRRLRGGPTAEKETRQKIIQAIAGTLFVAEIVIPAFDRRLHWSDVPAWLTVLGDLFVALGNGVIFLTFRENSFASAIIELTPDQRVISVGPYRIVRHPMYAGALLSQIFTPLALGSYWGLLVLVLMLPALIWRLIEEERLLVKRLPGYAEYRTQTRRRLIPGVF